MPPELLRNREVHACIQQIAHIRAPEVTREEWNEMTGEDITEDEWADYLDSDEGLRVLAERIGWAVSQRKDLLAALQGLLAAAEGAGNTWEAMNVAREAIKEATA